MFKFKFKVTALGRNPAGFVVSAFADYGTKIEIYLLPGAPPIPIGTELLLIEPAETAPAPAAEASGN